MTLKVTKDWDARSVSCGWNWEVTIPPKHYVVIAKGWSPDREAAIARGLEAVEAYKAYLAEKDYTEEFDL